MSPLLYGLEVICLPEVVSIFSQRSHCVVSKSNHSQTFACGLYPITRYARTYFVIKLVNCPVCSWSRKLKSLEESMAIYRCQTASQVALFVGFLKSWITLPTKTTKNGTLRKKVIYIIAFCF